MTYQQDRERLHGAIELLKSAARVLPEDSMVRSMILDWLVAKDWTRNET